MTRIINHFRMNFWFNIVMAILCIYAWFLQSGVFANTIVIFYGLSIPEAMHLNIIFCIILFPFYYLLLYTIYGSWVKVVINDIFIAFLIVSYTVYVVLNLNYKYAFGNWKKSRFDIISVKEVSVSKTMMVPEILIKKGDISKYIIKTDYRMNELAAKRYVLLKYRKGCLGWIVIKDLRIE